MPEHRGGAAAPSGGTNRRLAWLAGLAVAVQLLALYLPGSPDQPLELPFLPGADKVAHAFLFAVPVYLVGRLTARVGVVAVGFALHAVLSELIQGRIVPYRDADVWDVAADLVGIGLAVVLLKLRRPSGR
ncbi:MAG: hypothetical protein WCF12_06275 [Propionicimonas sp.]